MDLHDEPEAGDGDLLNPGAIQTVLNGGTAHLTDPEEVPGGADVACLFLY